VEKSNSTFHLFLAFIAPSINCLVHEMLSFPPLTNLFFIGQCKLLCYSTDTNAMALINCPECGREVSTEAKACPACGFPVAEKGLGFRSGRRR